MAKIERRICDRCGKEYEPKHSLFGISFGKFLIIRGNDVIYEENEYDLCSKCAEQIEEFLDFKEEE